MSHHRCCCVVLCGRTSSTNSWRLWGLVYLLYWERKPTRAWIYLDNSKVIERLFRNHICPQGDETPPALPSKLLLRQAVQTFPDIFPNSSLSAQYPGRYCLLGIFLLLKLALIMTTPWWTSPCLPSSLSITSLLLLLMFSPDLVTAQRSNRDDSAQQQNHRIIE